MLLAVVVVVMAVMVDMGMIWVVESMRAREPGLQALSNLAGFKIRNPYFFPPY